MNSKACLGLACLLLSVTAASAAYSATGPTSRTTIGLVAPQVQLGSGGSGDGGASPVRDALLSALQRPDIAVVPLDTRFGAPADAEAQAKGCTYILYTSVEQKASGLAMLKRFAPLASALPMLGAMGAAGRNGLGGAATSALAQSAMQASAQASAMSAQQAMLDQMAGLQRSTVKSGDSIAVEYRLMAPGSATPVRSDRLVGKAHADGEDVLSPLIAQLAETVSAATKSPATASATTTSSAATGNSSGTGGGFGSVFARFSPTHKAAAPAESSPAQQMDCDQIARMPNPPMSLEACRKLIGLQGSYDAALADPRASRPGDENLSCAQIGAEMSTLRDITPDREKARAAQSATRSLQTGIANEEAEAFKRAAADQAAVDAARATDTATEMATGGLVNPNAAGRAAQAAMERNQIANKEAAARMQPLQTNAMDTTANVMQDMGNKMMSNPRYARLIQLAGARNCKGPGRG